MPESKVVEMARRRKEFYREVDGFWYFDPIPHSGAFSESVLRELAAELERLNDPVWDEPLPPGEYQSA